MDTETQIRQLDDRVKRINLLGLPAALFTGLGLYSVFAADGRAFHVLLDSPTVGWALLLSGASAQAWVIFRVIPLIRRRRALSGQ